MLLSTGDAGESRVADAYRIGVVIPAAGSGRRMGLAERKQYIRVGGKPLLLHTLEAFDHIRAVKSIVVVVPAADVASVTAMVRRARAGNVHAVVPGGAERQDSVWCGLQAFATPPDIVLVHDAVRPLVAGRVIRAVARAAAAHQAAVVGVRVKDTIKVEEPSGFYARTIDRSALWAVQTPQGFRWELLLHAHRKAREDGFVGTDEASLVERLNLPVRIVEGDYDNIKVTTPEDLAICRFLMKSGRFLKK